jgi:nitric-oxide synthase, plant
MLHILTPAELKAIHPKRRLRPYVAAAPLEIAEQNDSIYRHHTNSASCTYLWGALMRIDVLEAPADTRFVFFGTGEMQVYACRLFRSDERLAFEDLKGGAREARVRAAAAAAAAAAAHPGSVTLEPFAAASVAARGGLCIAREATLPSAGFTTTLADLQMSGMPGWASVVSGGMPGTVRLRVWAPKGVEVQLRPPLPCPTPVNIYATT